jgi:hypothetical protein
VNAGIGGTMQGCAAAPCSVQYRFLCTVGDLNCPQSGDGTMGSEYEHAGGQSARGTQQVKWWNGQGAAESRTGRGQKSRKKKSGKVEILDDGGSTLKNNRRPGPHPPQKLGS